MLPFPTQLTDQEPEGTTGEPTETLKSQEPVVSVLHDERIEAAVIGAILTRPDAYFEVSDFLDGDDFFDLRYRTLWNAIQVMNRRQHAVDVLSLESFLKESGQLENAGGTELLLRLAAEVPDSLNIVTYAQSVSNFSLRRRLQLAGGTVATIANNGQLSPEEIVAKTEAAIFEAVSHAQDGRTRPLQEVLAEASEQIRQRSRQPGLTGVPSGFVDLDTMLGGMQKSDLLVIAGRPGMGKTGFLLSVALNAANAGAHVGIFSLEMSSEQIVQRLIAHISEIDTQRLRTGALNDEDWKRFDGALEAMDSLQIFLDDTPAISPSQLRTRCMRLAADHGLDLVILDYLQLMSSDGRNENRTQEVSYISRSLKQLARELNVPVLAAAQLSRGVDARTDKRPMLSDLRESGAIEQDSDIVIFPFRPEVYEPANISLRGSAELIVAKHRNGPVGTVELIFKGSLTKFEDAATPYQPEQAPTNYDDE
jgi:replicative DNA helicase